MPENVNLNPAQAWFISTCNMELAQHLANNDPTEENIIIFQEACLSVLQCSITYKNSLIHEVNANENATYH